VRDLDSNSVNSLHTETVKLKRLIEDLHTLSLADTGALDYKMQNVNLTEVLQKHISGVNEKNIGLKVNFYAPETPIFINGDQQRITQLIDNLTQNTVRYTDMPGVLNISIAAAQNGVTLSWADSAPGVASDALSKLFDPLFREEASRNREHGGSGLGLSIVKKIVDAHSGTCEAVHSDQGGLEIKINFPNTGHL